MGCAYINVTRHGPVAGFDQQVAEQVLGGAATAEMGADHRHNRPASLQVKGAAIVGGCLLHKNLIQRGPVALVTGPCIAGQHLIELVLKQQVFDVHLAPLIIGVPVVFRPG